MYLVDELLGGAVIGFASALPLWGEGRISGVSGYAAQAARPGSAEGRRAWYFVSGLVLGGFLWWISGGNAPAAPLAAQSWPGLALWAVAGLLVGFGSRMGGGCTSGHGVCGIGRASPRSLVAVAVFMTAGIITASLLRSFA